MCHLGSGAGTGGTGEVTLSARLAHSQKALPKQCPQLSLPRASPLLPHARTAPRLSHSSPSTGRLRASFSLFSLTQAKSFLV